MQKVVLGHDTPVRLLPVKPARLGLVATVHADPFHCSTSVLVVLVPVSPTATQSVAVAQLTATREPCPLSEGVAANVHAEPVHCSTSGSVRPPMLW